MKRMEMDTLLALNRLIVRMDMEKTSTERLWRRRKSAALPYWK